MGGNGKSSRADIAFPREWERRDLKRINALPDNVPGAFSPVIDVVAADIGLVAAAVYGAIWRFCQGDQHVCNASLETIAARVHLTRRCIAQQIAVLEQKGYIEDLTPKRKGRPHSYRDLAGGYIARGEAVPRPGNDVPNSPDPSEERGAGVVPPPQAWERGSQVGENDVPRPENVVPRPENVVPTKRHGKRQPKRQERDSARTRPRRAKAEPVEPEPPGPEHQRMIAALVRATRMDPGLNVKRLAGASKKLRDHGYRAEHIDQFMLWWNSYWKSRKGRQRPSLANIEEHIGEALSSTEPSASGSWGEDQDRLDETAGGEDGTDPGQ